MSIILEIKTEFFKGLFSVRRYEKSSLHMRYLKNNAYSHSTGILKINDIAGNRKPEDIYKCVSESLCCTPETNTIP